jgi:sugar lactone lactonase YvrE
MLALNQRSEPPEAFPGHDGGVWEPKPWDVVARWPVGSFAENLAISQAGDVFVSLHSHNRIDRFTPTSRSTTTFAKLPAPVCGLCFDANGFLWVTGGTVGTTPGYVWRLSTTGTYEPWVEIPDARFMNGCTPHPDGNSVLACESLTGRILKISTVTAAWSVWLSDSRLCPSNPQMPGANGIKLKTGHAYISVTDHNQVFRAPIERDGTCGPLSIHARDLRADDFAFGVSGSVYIATHPANSVVRLAPDGSRVTIGGPSEGLVGSTACAFGRTNDDARSLYVTTNGGLYGPYHGVVQEAKLVRLDVGDTGVSLLHPA